MSCIYTAINGQARKYGSFKIGQTEHKYPTSRINANSLECIYYLSCPNITPTELDLLETLAAYVCQQMGLELQSGRKDWFWYNIDHRFASREAQAERFASTIMKRLIQECEQMGVRYEVRACYYNGKRYSCAASKTILL